MSRKALAQPVVSESDHAARGGFVREGVEHHEVVNDSLVAHGGDVYARLSELVGIRLSLIAKHVGFYSALLGSLFLTNWERSSSRAGIPYRILDVQNP